MTTADERYAAACHAMQSGVAMEMSHRPQPTEPKHLRVGVNSALVETGALAKILIDAGIISEEQYREALADAMEREQARYETYLSQLVGTRVTLA